MTLEKGNSSGIEGGQAAAIKNAGGVALEGFFSWTCTGWEITLRKLTFDECVQVADAANHALRPAESPASLHQSISALLKTYGLDEVMEEVTTQWRRSQMSIRDY